LPHTRRLAGQTAGFAAIAIALSVLAAAPAAPQARLGGTGADKAVKKAAEAPEPVLAVVSIARQRVEIYAGAGVIAQSPVSTGMPGFRTPTGVFSVLQRSRYHRSNIYSDAPMPYMQRLTWQGVALHAGVLPGYPASHGCIRMPYQFAVELWGLTRLGTRVVVAPDDPPVLPIEHARLPVPRLAPAESYGPGGDTERPEVHVSELAPAVGGTASDVESALPAAPPRLVNPQERAKARKAAASAAAIAGTRAARLAAQDAAARAAAARRAAAALRAAEAALAMAQRRHAAASRADASASRPAAAERAKDALAAAEAKLEEAQRDADNARLADAALAREAADAAAAAAQAETARREAEAAVKEAERAAAPLSIFVSRKAGRVFIRQAWVPVHEAPVAFADGEFTLGTHLYLAMGASEGGEALRWVSVSPASKASAPPLPRGKPGTAAPAPDSAADALLRFELPEETRQFIADRLWTGAALIVSDHAGSQTGTYTDFIVQTR
jgi:hypothetical protein